MATPDARLEALARQFESNAARWRKELGECNGSSHLDERNRATFAAIAATYEDCAKLVRREIERPSQQ